MNNILRRLKAPYVLAFRHESTAIQGLPGDPLSNGLLAEFPTILDSFSPVLSIPQALLQGWWGSHEVMGSFRVKHFQGDVASTDAQLHSKYHKK